MAGKFSSLRRIVGITMTTDEIMTLTGGQRNKVLSPEY